MSTPHKVSIVIPVYNGANFLRKAIDSALSQTYPHIEVIVVNDGSTDDGATERIALSYGDKIRYFAKDNGGVSSALNMGLDQMTGQYFTWLSHDDVYLPQKVERQYVSVSDDDDLTTISVCSVTDIDQRGRKIRSAIVPERVRRSLRCFLALDTTTGVNGCALLIPKVLFDKVGRFNPALRVTQDYDMWFRLSYHARFVYLSDELVLSRTHEAQASRTMGNAATLEADQLHSAILSRVQLNEFLDFVGKDSEYLEKSLKTFTVAGYNKTAARPFALSTNPRICTHDRAETSRLLQGGLGTPPTKGFLDWLTSADAAPSQKPIILVYCNVWTKGGIERVITVLFEELAGRFTFILVSNTPFVADAGYPLPAGVTHIHIHPASPSELPYVLLMLADLTDASLLIGNPNIMMEMLAVYPVMKACGKRTVAWNHSHYFLPTWAPWLQPIMTDRLPLLNDATVATWPTSFSANVYALSNPNGAHMPNPNAFGRILDNVRTPPGPIVLAVGRFQDAIKRLDRILKVFRIVVDRHPDAKLLIVGAYDLKQRIPLTARETVGDLLTRLHFPPSCVRFEGEQEDVATYYRAARVLILTSDSEGFALVLNEAGAFGVPNVAFEISGLEDLVTDGKNGFFVPQDDLSLMADKISQILTDNELWSLMSRNAVEMVKQFDRKRIAARWADLITAIASSEQNLLRDRLARDFKRPPKDRASFSRALEVEYENALRTVPAQGRTRVPGNGPVQASTPLNSAGPVAKAIYIAKKTLFIWRHYGAAKALRRGWTKIKRKVSQR